MIGVPALLEIGLILGLGAVTFRAVRIGRERRRMGALEKKLKRWPAHSRKTGPMDGTDWYLAGCTAARAGQMRDAARFFGMAHHANCRLQTAALLTFSALKAAEGVETDLLAPLVRTWDEMKRPDILGERDDRLVIETLTSNDPSPPDCSALGRLAWIVSGRPQRRRLEQLIVESPDWAMPLIGGDTTVGRSAALVDRHS